MLRELNVVEQRYRAVLEVLAGAGWPLTDHFRSVRSQSAPRIGHRNAEGPASFPRQGL